MKNDFPAEIFELFFGDGWCQDWEDGRNDANCLHHILKRINNSPYNACPLNNKRNHLPEGCAGQNLPPPLHAFSTQKAYLTKTKAYLAKIGYQDLL